MVHIIIYHVIYYGTYHNIYYNIYHDVVAIKTYEELMQFFTRTRHEEFEMGGVEIGIPKTKPAFEHLFQILDLVYIIA